LSGSFFWIPFSKCRGGQKAKGRNPEDNAKVQELTRKLKPLNELKKRVGERIKALKEEAKRDPLAQSQIEELQKREKEKKSDLYNSSEAPWGSLLKVDQAVDLAKKSGGIPHFKKWDGSGQLTVQIQKRRPLSGEDLFSELDTRVRVKPVPQEAWNSPVRSIRRKLSRTELKIRISSQNKAGEIYKGGRTPVWATFPMIMHRPLPKNCSIKWVQVQREKIANRHKWSVNITVEEPDIPLSYEEGDSVALDIGWRRVDGGLRVAYWFDGKEHGQLILPDSVIGALEKVKSLGSIRDKNFDDIRKTLIPFLKENSLPKWLKEGTKGLPRWRSKKKLAKVVLQWKREEDRPAGDEEILEQLEA